MKEDNELNAKIYGCGGQSQEKKVLFKLQSNKTLLKNKINYKSNDAKEDPAISPLPPWDPLPGSDETLQNVLASTVFFYKE